MDAGQSGHNLSRKPSLSRPSPRYQTYTVGTLRTNNTAIAITVEMGLVLRIAATVAVELTAKKRPHVPPESFPCSTTSTVFLKKEKAGQREGKTVQA